jgi:4'-phosphopantetheinyl transferase
LRRSNGSCEATDDAFEPSTTRIDIVRCCLNRGPEDVVHLLDDAERARAARFVFERHRRRFIVAHAFLRSVLARCLALPPDALRFTTNEYGKPRLADPPIDLRFNLSHAGELALVAVTLEREVGVDIERHSPIEAIAVAGHFFADGERACLRSLEPSEQLKAFYRCWTRKESFVKAVGSGLTFALDAFEVDLMSVRQPQLLRSCRSVPGAVRDWRIVSLPIDGEYSAALAAENGDWSVVVHSSCSL